MVSNFCCCTFSFCYYWCIFSPKVTFHLQAVPPSKSPGPVSRSRYDYIKFSFKSGGDIEFHKQVEVAIQVINY